ncbi:MauE/DoxX family redox-associated membrane protein [Zunongwangia profunda]|uniref:MauE/DoxX family redox-associated membrane protein n=1 Tax=Zunongwangia profunda TaxID=398743 RepID=UPI001D17E9C3|nr:MauE/DoxX family redox-associated membrane protein [Zunongwangia profunda]MCC4228622.1 hypothetical protein [Zunongwangia profunda]
MKTTSNHRMQASHFRSINYSRVLEAILLYYFILLLSYAALSKITEGNSLYTSLMNAPLYLSAKLAAVGQWLIPITELVLAISISFKSTRRIGYLSIALLFILLSVYTGWIIWFLPNKPCSCGGLISLLSWKQHVVFNLVNLILSLVAWYLTKREVTANPKTI